MEPFSMVVALLLPILLLLLLSVNFFFSKNNKNALPPGPRGVPILGYLPFMGANMLLQFTDLSHKYGPIYKLRLGSKLAVVISSPSLVKQVVRDQDPNFSHRDATVAAFTYSRGAKGIVFSPPDSSWRAMRKVMVQETQSSTGLDASYRLRKEQLRKAVAYVYSKSGGEAIDIGALVFQTQVNVVMNLMWGGIEFGKESQRLGDEFKALNSELSYLFSKPNVSDLFPILSWLDLQGVKKRMGKVVDSLDKILEKIISQHEKNLSGSALVTHENIGRKDFLQTVLENKDSDLPTLSRDQLKCSVSDIVAAGSETVAVTVNFVMAELLNSPESMKKVQKELLEVVGMSNIVEEYHLPKLDYLKAVIKETLRMYPPVPFLVPRSPLQTSTLGGYTIPEGTKILINAWAMHRDPSIWDNPTEFKPERFLHDGEGVDFKGNSFHFIPFGSGRRICPGLPLAERMVAYFVASFMHSFDWKLQDEKKLDMSVTFGFALTKTNPTVAIPTPRLSDASLYT